MPYLKFTRDKRGYEHFYIVDHGSGRRGKSQILFAFCTPPNVKVGRTPFPEEVRRALESAYPGISFDWDALLATPIPSAEAERWRERRRAERAARRQTPTEERAEEGDEAPEPDEAEHEPAEDEPPVSSVAAQPVPDPVTPADVLPGSSTEAGGARKRRRRRRRRGRGRPEGAASAEAPAPAPASEAAGDPDEGV